MLGITKTLYFYSIVKQPSSQYKFVQYSIANIINKSIFYHNIINKARCNGKMKTVRTSCAHYNRAHTRRNSLARCLILQYKEKTMLQFFRMLQTLRIYFIAFFIKPTTQNSLTLFYRPLTRPHLLPIFTDIKRNVN